MLYTVGMNKLDYSEWNVLWLNVLTEEYPGSNRRLSVKGLGLSLLWKRLSMTRSKKRDSFTAELEPGARAVGAVQSCYKFQTIKSELY